MLHQCNGTFGLSIFLYLDVCKRIFLDTVTNAKKGSAVQQNCQNGIALKNLVFCKNCVWVFLVLSFHSKKRANALWNGTSFKISSNYISDVKQYLIIFSYWCISFSTWICFKWKEPILLNKNETVLNACTIDFCLQDAPQNGTALKMPV